MKIKPPIAVKVKNFSSFARLSLALTESPPLLWNFKHKGQNFLGIFSVYMSWRGDLPLFAYIRIRGHINSFLAYKCDLEQEEYMFANNIDDTRYFYAPIIKLKEAPKMFESLLEKKPPSFDKPLSIELDSLYSLTRLLYLISMKELTSFPVWRFKKDKKYILGACIPFEHYYDASALPIFFFTKFSRLPSEPFIKYGTSKVEGETLEYSKITGDTKFFYVKIIDVEDMPLFS